jgi:hypothetical protein
MQRSATVADFLDALEHELRFDRELAGRVRSEVEDHLAEAIADEPTGDAAEAARRAIARFGTPRGIAQQYAPSSLLRQVRQVGAVLIVAIAAILVLMKGRGVLYQFLQWQLHTDWLGIGAVGPMIDIYAFRAALIAGVLGWFYIASRRVAPSLHAGVQSELRRCLVLPMAASVLLVAAVGLDTILGALRMLDARLSPAALIPIASIAVEAALVAAIAVLMRRTFQRAALAASLFTEQKTR